jgi:RNA polymerase sigma factor (sigma-70 family)
MAAEGRDGMADTEQFDGFVVTRSPALLRTAFLLTHDEGRAEDLVQTALAKAWFAWSRIEDPEAYVRRIMVTTSASWWRRRWTKETPSGGLPDHTFTTSTDSVTPMVAGSARPFDSDHVRDHASDHDLWVAIGHLPARQRAVVVLRYLEDRSEAQTAELLGCSVGTVKSQAAKALAKLRLDEALMSAADEGTRP